MHDIGKVEVARREHDAGLLGRLAGDAVDDRLAHLQMARRDMILPSSERDVAALSHQDAAVPQQHQVQVDMDVGPGHPALGGLAGLGSIGTASRTPRMSSSAAAALSNSASPRGAPTSWMPTGRPSSVKPAGMLIAGQVVSVMQAGSVSQPM